MTTISAALVKELRDATGAGMMDCKRALEEAGGDLEAARVLLRERGLATAGKKAERATADGRVGYIVSNGAGAILGVGSETDFVAKNDEFQAFAEKVLRAIHAEGESALETFEPERLELIGKLGENIVFVGAARFESSNGHVIAGYTHPPANKIGVLIELAGGTPELARQLAMHISWAAPEWKTKSDVPEATLAAERQIYLRSDDVQSKPEAAREKIVDGMLAKRFFAATPGGVLLDQPWISEPAKTVEQVLGEAGATVERFTRIAVGG
jgi:elongation factor Ts